MSMNLNSAMDDSSRLGITLNLSQLDIHGPGQGDDTNDMGIDNNNRPGPPSPALSASTTTSIIIYTPTSSVRSSSIPPPAMHSVQRGQNALSLPQPSQRDQSSKPDYSALMRRREEIARSRGRLRHGSGRSIGLDTPEETARIEIIRELNKINRKSDNLLARRRQCHERYSMRRNAIPQWRNTTGAANRELTATQAFNEDYRAAREEELAIQRYRDKFRYGEILHEADDETIPTSLARVAARHYSEEADMADQQRMAQEVHDAFLARSVPFDVSPGDQKKDNLTSRLRIVFGALQTGFWDHVKSTEWDQNCDIEIGALRYLKESCPAIPDTKPRPSIDPLLDGFLRNIASAMAAGVKQDQEKQQESDHPQDQGPWTFPACDALMCTKNEYVRWTFGIILEEVRTSCLRLWRREQRAATISAFQRESGPSQRATMSLEFIPNIHNRGTVSLVGFKGTKPTALRHLSSRELRQFGWRRGPDRRLERSPKGPPSPTPARPGPGRFINFFPNPVPISSEPAPTPSPNPAPAIDEYWRYKTAGPNFLFKVNMDGELLGVREKNDWRVEGAVLETLSRRAHQSALRA